MEQRGPASGALQMQQGDCGPGLQHTVPRDASGPWPPPAAARLEPAALTSRRLSHAPGDRAEIIAREGETLELLPTNAARRTSLSSETRQSSGVAMTRLESARRAVSERTGSDTSAPKAPHEIS